MKHARKNSKVGRCLLVSRPVGLSCPPDCPFLGNGCYAEGTEKVFPNSRTAAFENMSATAGDVSKLIEFACVNSYPIRIHERGDFCYNGGKVDMPYVKAWRDGINDCHELPFIWTYTHKYSKYIANIPQVSMYASVHNRKDISKAKRAGFNLFAWCSKIRGKRGGNRDAPKFLNVPGIGKTLVCPEQRLGRKRVTCDKCKWCIEGKGHVTFLEH